MNQEKLICKDCGVGYELTAGEESFYEGMKEKIPTFVMPKRCRDCRYKRKEERNGARPKPFTKPRDLRNIRNTW